LGTCDKKRGDAEAQSNLSKWGWWKATAESPRRSEGAPNSSKKSEREKARKNRIRGAMGSKNRRAKEIGNRKREERGVKEKP